MNENINRETLLNPLLFNDKSETTNNDNENNDIINKDTILNNKYLIIDRLQDSSSKTQVYLAKYNNQYYTLKVYNKDFKISLDILDILKKLEFDYLEKIYEYFELDDQRQVIVSKYYLNGNLKDKKISIKDLKDYIIPSLNEAINILHENHILHMDIKPANIMFADDKKHVVLIDYSSALKINNIKDVIICQKPFITPHYSAIETCTSHQCSIYSDYYSFGITLYELLLGHSPFINLDDEQIIRFMQTNRLAFDESIDLNFKNLILGLTYRDIANRNDYNNFNVRWTYKQVSDWLNGKTMIVPGEGILTKTNIMPFNFKNKVYLNVDELIDALAINWNDGIRCLSSKNLSNYFKNINHQYYEITLNFEIKFFDKNIKINPDVEFFKYIYTLLPQTSKFYYKGFVYESIQDLGFALIDTLDANKDTETSANFFKNLLKNKILSTYCSLKSIDNQEMIDMIKEIENTFQSELLTNREKQKNLYTLSYILTGQKEYKIDDQIFNNKDDFINYIVDAYKKSFTDLNKICKTLMPRRNLDVKLEAWLDALGYKNEVNKFIALITTQGGDEE